VGKDSLVHQDFDELDFRFYVKAGENLDKSRMDLVATPRKILLAAGGEMLEGDFEVSVKNYYIKPE